MKAELFNYHCWIDQSDAKALNAAMHKLLVQAEFEILGQIDHHFEPQGYTSLWLLGESHLAIHTYPEHNTCYVELTSCALNKNQIFIDGLGEIFVVSRENEVTKN